MSNVDQIKKFRSIINESFEEPQIQPEITESADEYEDSAEFTDEFYTISDHLNSIQKIATSPKFMAWMEITDQNYGTNCVEPTQRFIKLFLNAVKTYNVIDDEICKAE